MDRIAHLLVHRPKPVLALTALCTLFSLLMLTRMSFNADITEFMTSGNERGEALAALQSKYQTADPIQAMVSLPEGRSFSSAVELSHLARLRDNLRDQQGVASVTSLLPETHPMTGAVLDASAVSSLPSMIVDGPLLKGPVASLLLSEDRRHTLMMIVPEAGGIKLAGRLDELLVKPVAGGLEVSLSGNPVIFASVIGMLSWFLLVIPPLVIVLLLGTFFANIGDRKLTILAVLPAILGSIWTFGLIFGLGKRVDIVTVIVPIFIIVMGSADGLHFVMHFQEEVTRTKDKVERVATTLRQVGIPMILTTISTAAGFLSLLATDVRPMRQMGVFVAAGITFAGIISFFFLPALLSKLDVQPRHHDAVLGRRLTALIKKLATRRLPAVALVVALLGFSAVGIPRLEVDTDQLFFFKADHPIRANFAQMKEIFGGATPLVGEFAFDPTAGSEQLDGLRATSRQLEGLPGVERVFSVADLQGKLPGPAAASLLDPGASGPLGKMVSDDGLRFVLFPGEFEATDLQGWLAFAESNESIRILSGMPVIWDEVARLVLRAQSGSLIAAFSLVLLMLLLAYRKLGQTLVALAPLALTVGTLLGFIALSGIQLNLMTAIVSSIVIGVGIDYSIHLVAAIDYARNDGDGYVLRAIDKAGRPILANALGIALGLTALWLSPLRIHSQVSMIMWVAMSTAALTTLLVIPALSPRSGLAMPRGDGATKPLGKPADELSPDHSER